MLFRLVSAVVFSFLANLATGSEVYASCVSMEDGFGTCPIGPAQVKSLEEASACSGTTSAVTTDRLRETCVAQAAAKTSAHPLYAVFGVMGVESNQPQWIQNFINEKLGGYKDSLVDEFARAEFEASVRGEEINVAATRTKYYQLKTRADASTMTNRNLKAEQDFRDFNNSEEMRTIRRVYGLNPNNTNVFIERNASLDKKVFYPNTQNGLLREDLANLDWDDVPESVTTTKGQRLGLKSKYLEDAHRIFNEISAQLQQGKSLKEIMNSQKMINMGVTGERKRRIGQAIVMAGRDAQFESYAANRRADLVPRVGAKDGRKHRNRLRRIAVGLGIVGIGVEVAWGILKQGADNQAMCDQSYPYSVVRYEQPAVSAPPDPAMFCKLAEVDPRKPIPTRALNIAKLPSTEIAQILDSDLRSNSTCSYFVNQFNARFCSRQSPSAEGREGQATEVTH